VSLQRELQTLNIYNISLLDIATLQNISLPLILQLVVVFSFQHLANTQGQRMVANQKPSTYVCLELLSENAMALCLLPLFHSFMCIPNSLSLANILRYQVKEKSTNISFTVCLSVLFPRNKGVLKEKLKEGYCSMFYKIVVMRIESIGVGPAFVNKNQIVPRFAGICYYYFYRSPRIGTLVNIILSYTNIYNFNLS